MYSVICWLILVYIWVLHLCHLSAVSLSLFPFVAVFSLVRLHRRDTCSLEHSCSLCLLNCCSISVKAFILFASNSKQNIRSWFFFRCIEMILGKIWLQQGVMIIPTVIQIQATFDTFCYLFCTVGYTILIWIWNFYFQNVSSLAYNL